MPVGAQSRPPEERTRLSGATVVDEPAGHGTADDQDPRLRGQAQDHRHRPEARTDHDFVENHR